MSGSRVLGIDLGTTHSLVAIREGGAVRLLRDASGSPLVPSAVALDEGGHLLVGAPALERLGYAPEAGARRFKRDMGTDRKTRIGDRTYSPVELSAMVLRELRELATASLGEPVDRAVITVPAYFREPQRASTAEAGRLAGLEVVRMINEPTAAAIAYGIEGKGREARCVVVDLGGGTFDVTVLELFEGVIEVVASTGDSHLGGEDFTDSLVDLALASRGARSSELDPKTRAALVGACERAKRMLTEEHEVVVPLPADADDTALRGAPFRLHRDVFEQVNAPRLDRARLIVRDALVQARLSPADIDEVVLVGGATRMASMHALVRDVLGRDPVVRIDPDHAVAIGAAHQAEMVRIGRALDEVVVTDVVPFTLGVAVVRDAHGVMMSDCFLPIIHRNTTIPVSRTTEVATLHPKQTEVRVLVYQGEHRTASHNEKLGELRVEAIPPLVDATEGGQPVELTLTHDVNGLLEVEAKVLATGKRVSAILERSGVSLSPEQRRLAIAAIERLKVHPRELLPNRHLLEKARRCFAQLDPRRRELLDLPLLGFEAALEKREPELIARSAATLRAALAALGAA